MKPLLLFLSFTFGLASTASAMKIGQRVTFADVSPIYVSINDYAKGGCWTNLKEVKTYASDKIELAGGKLVPALEDVMGQGIGFVIIVNANRHPQLGVCYGSIAVTTETIGTAPHLPEVMGLLTISVVRTNFIDAGNFNQHVLDTVSKALDEWK